MLLTHEQYCLGKDRQDSWEFYLKNACYLGLKALFMGKMAGEKSWQILFLKVFIFKIQLFPPLPPPLPPPLLLPLLFHHYSTPDCQNLASVLLKGAKRRQVLQTTEPEQILKSTIAAYNTHGQHTGTCKNCGCIPMIFICSKTLTLKKDHIGLVRWLSG